MLPLTSSILCQLEEREDPEDPTLTLSGVLDLESGRRPWSSSFLARAALRLEICGRGKTSSLIDLKLDKN